MVRCFFILISCLGVSTAVAYWQTTPRKNTLQSRLGSPTGDVNRYDPTTVLPRAIRPVTDPAVVRASESQLSPNALVIGVELNDEARAYPINQLTGPAREIINDHLGGTAIAATW